MRRRKRSSRVRERSGDRERERARERGWRERLLLKRERGREIVIQRGGERGRKTAIKERCSNSYTPCCPENTLAQIRVARGRMTVKGA